MKKKREQGLAPERTGCAGEKARRNDRITQAYGDHWRSIDQLPKGTITHFPAKNQML
jgi:hypothetical protein